MKSIAFYRETCKSGYTFIVNQYRAEEALNEETLFTLSNGYLGLRGATELPALEKDAATYLAGIYDKKETEEKAANRGVVKNKAITPAYATVPDCNLFSVSANGEEFDFINGKIFCYERILDMKRGLLFNEYGIESACGKRLSVKTMGLVSKADRHLVFFKTEITPLNFEGNLAVSFKNELFGHAKEIRRLKDYISRTKLIGAGKSGKNCFLEAEVSETKSKIFLETRTSGAGERIVARTQNGADERFILSVAAKKTFSFEKRAAFYTSRDASEPIFLTSETEEKIVSEHTKKWGELWENADVKIDGDEEVQIALRWNIFNLLQLAAPEDPDVSISATGLHGQGYFGHVFWDTEIFMIPFYLAALPQETKSLLLYRYRRLNEARKLAKKDGYRGARFPWTSAYTGSDVTPPDWAESANREIHISGAVAYAMHNYYMQTGDEEFYKTAGVETITETAKYYASRAVKDKKGKYHLLDVTGPDEYNIHVNDNYYTNYLAAWNMREAAAAAEWLKTEDAEAYSRLCRATGFNEETGKFLRNVAGNMFFPPVKENVCEQFDGFFALKDPGEIPRDEYGMPKDRKRIFDSGLQELKQADVVMLFYLFPDDFPKEIQKASFAYYEKRCKHGSSLSPSIHCVTGLRNGFGDRAYGYLYLTALLDFKNLHLDKNLFEGIHIACSGGAWAAAVYGFGGLNAGGAELSFDPVLPEKWKSLTYSAQHRGVTYKVNVTKERIQVIADKNTAITVLGRRYELKAGEPFYSERQI